MEFYCDHSNEYKSPKGPDTIYPWEFRQKPYSTHPMPFVAVIPNGQVWGAKGAVISQDNKLIWDLSLEYSGQVPEQHSVFIQINLPPVQYHDETLGVLTYTASDNYFHWMLDVLPRIDLLRKSGIAIDRFVCNTNPALAYQQETLSILDIPPSKQINVVWNSHLQARKLVVPSLIGYTSNYPKWAIDSLKKLFFIASQPEHADKYERIYLSRGDASHRKVVNEEQVLNLLEPFRFKKITTSEYSVSEQIRIFSSAKIIISPHGANMTNILFCKPGTKVIELFSPGYVNPIYWVLSSHAELDYYYLIGNGRRSSDYVFESARWSEDIEVDIDQLSRLLQLAGL